MGLKIMSIGLLIDPDQPMPSGAVPMVTQALTQLLTETEWGELDYLVLDLPPGTGDLQLTLAQRVPVAGAVVVTTPQKIAVADARKGLKMFEKVNVPVLGVVENMSTHVCSHCGHEDAPVRPWRWRVRWPRMRHELLARCRWMRHWRGIRPGRAHGGRRARHARARRPMN